MACHSQEEIAQKIGYSQQAIGEFLNLLQDTKNGSRAENGNLLEDEQLADMPFQEFEEPSSDETNSLGVYELDRRLLIKANHLDEHYKPPLYKCGESVRRETADS